MGAPDPALFATSSLKEVAPTELISSLEAYGWKLAGGTQSDAEKHGQSIAEKLKDWYAIWKSTAKRWSEASQRRQIPASSMIV